MSRSQRTREALAAIDASRSSIASLDPALSNLSSQDVETLDAIIFKVPDATSFTTIFKAYSEVLEDRGLDPSSDVLYYKQLLKLGVVKGSTWGHKWQAVKEQLGIKPAFPPTPKRRIPFESKSLQFSADEDVFTSHTQGDSTETAVEPQAPITRLWPQWTADDTHITATSTPRRILRPIPSQPTRRTSISSATSGLEELRAGSPTPIPQTHSKITSIPLRKQSSILPSPLRDKGHISDADTWKKIQEDRDMEDADRFQRESLYLKYFQKWKVYLDWVHVRFPLFTTKIPADCLSSLHISRSLKPEIRSFYKFI